MENKELLIKQIKKAHVGRGEQKTTLLKNESNKNTDNNKVKLENIIKLGKRKL